MFLRIILIHLFIIKKNIKKNILTGDRWQVTYDTWKVTNDTWHMTRDTWHIVWDKHSLIFFAPKPFGFGIESVWKIFWLKDDSINESLNHGGNCRTAPATPGLSNIYQGINETIWYGPLFVGQHLAPSCKGLWPLAKGSSWPYQSSIKHSFKLLIKKQKSAWSNTIFFW